MRVSRARREGPRKEELFLVIFSVDSWLQLRERSGSQCLSVLLLRKFMQAMQINCHVKGVLQKWGLWNEPRRTELGQESCFQSGGERRNRKLCKWEMKWLPIVAASPRGWGQRVQDVDRTDRHLSAHTQGISLCMEHPPPLVQNMSVIQIPS